jgi:hypothetical protein
LQYSRLELPFAAGFPAEFGTQNALKTRGRGTVFGRIPLIVNELRRISGCVKALFADYLCAFCSILLRFGLSRVALAGREPDVFDS